MHQGKSNIEADALSRLPLCHWIIVSEGMIVFESRLDTHIQFFFAEKSSKEGGCCREVIWEQESSGEPNHHAKF